MTHIHCGGTSPLKSIATPVAIKPGLQYKVQAHRAGFRVTDHISGVDNNLGENQQVSLGFGGR